MSRSLVVITGASSGIGKALAQKFSDQKYPCLLISRNVEPMEELAKREVLYKQVDVTNYEDFKKAIEDAEGKYGKVECMINNAGLINIGEFRGMSLEKCTQEIDVLLKGVMHGIKAVLSDMSKRKSGTIINMSSIGDRKPFPQAVTYHASKHAVRSIAESLQVAEAKTMCES